MKRTVDGYRDATGSFFRTVTTSTSPNTFSSGGMVFQVADLPAYSDFTNLFDEYRINKVTVRFQPAFNSANPEQQAIGGSAFTESLPQILTAVDTEGVFGGSSMVNMLQYGNVKWHDATKAFTVSFVPAAYSSLQVNISSGLTANVGKQKGKWIALDGSGAGVDFYGLMVATKSAYIANALPQSMQWNWDVYVTYDLSLRRVS